MKRNVIALVFILILSETLTGAIEFMIKPLWVYKIAFPEQSALRDFEFEDFVFSVRKPKSPNSKDITLVNLGHISRKEIAALIDTINQHHPKVIGLDAFFNCLNGKQDSINCPQRLDTVGNRLLHEAIEKSKKVVLVTRLLWTEKMKKASDSIESLDHYFFDSLELSDPPFSNYARNGFANLSTSGSGDAMTCRSFCPKLKINGSDQFSYAVEVAMKVDSMKTSEFLKRATENEIINYTGNIKALNGKVNGIYTEKSFFNTLDTDEILAGKIKPTDIKDKIVMIGYMGDYLSDNTIENMYYSPMNANPLGKSLPDMYGIVIHANIVQMILNKDFINRVPQWIWWIVQYAIIIMNILVFIWAGTSIESMERGLYRFDSRKSNHLLCTASFFPIRPV